MREICFGGALCCLILGVFLRANQDRLRAKPITVPVPIEPAVPPPLPHPPPPEPPPAASVQYVGEDTWTVTMPTDTAWFDTSIPVAAQFQVWIEPSEPAADCQFLMQVGGQVYSSEIVAEKGAPDTQRIRRVFPWAETPDDVPIWVESVKLRLAASCRRESLTLDIESASIIQDDDPLFRLEENAERRQRVLASHAAARYLQHLFESKAEKK